MLAKLDGRTREAALMRRVRAELTAHVGGEPTVTQRLLIERAAILSLRVAQLDARILTGELLTQHDNQHGLAWNNALRRTVVALGLYPAVTKAPTLAEAMAEATRDRASHERRRVA